MLYPENSLRQNGQKSLSHNFLPNIYFMINSEICMNKCLGSSLDNLLSLSLSLVDLSSLIVINLSFRLSLSDSYNTR